MRTNLLVGLFPVLALTCLSGWARAQATNAAPAGAATNAPSAVQPAAVSLADVSTAIGQDSNRIQEIQAGITGDHTVADVERTLADSVQQIDQRKLEDDRMLAGSPTLPVLRSAQEVWRTLADTLAFPQQTLATRISQINDDDSKLSEMGGKWKATRAAAKASAAPGDLLARIDAVSAAIAQASKAIESLRTQIWSAQSKVASQDARIQAELTAIKKAQAAAASALFVRDSAPIWGLSGAPGTQPGGQAASAPLLTPEIADLRTYVGEKLPTALLHLLIFNGFALVLFWVRRQVSARAADDPIVQHSAEVFQVPIAMAAVLALLLSPWFYPLAPRLFHAGLGAAALIPAVIILRRLIEPSLFPILYAMVLAYFTDQLRSVLTNEPLAARAVFLVEILAAIFFLLWLLRSKRLAHAKEDLLERTVRAYAWVACVFFGLAAIANVLGYTKLSSQVGMAMLGSSYLAVILYAAVRVTDGLTLAALRIRPFSLLGMVQRHYLLIAQRVSIILRWVAFLYWLWESTVIFTQTPDFIHLMVWPFLTYTIQYGSIDLSLWPLLLFGVTIWATVQVSRLIRFILEEEIYPNLRLASGIPYAISNMVHYTVLVLGTLFALSAVKIDLSKYTVLVGALGVGLGFGLQNILNNFVSGIILLFERPIKVGDVIQVDAATMGTVERIGIRASVIRVTNGSEIILPNGNLISNQVINWTLSDRRRAIDIPVTVAAKTDPQKVIGILTAAAKAHSLVLQDPAPRVLFTNITGGALNFELRAWTNSYDSWGQIRSELYVAISDALARENIAMA